MNELSQENLSKVDFPSPNSPHFSDSFFSDERRQGKKYLVFYLTDAHFAVSARQVSEIVHLPAVTPLPNVPEWLLGIVLLRGEIISVAHLPKLWNKKNFPLSSKTKLVVLRGENSNASVAFTTDKLGETIALPDSEIETGKENAPEIFGQAVYKSSALRLLDAENLISSLKAALKKAQAF